MRVVFISEKGDITPIAEQIQQEGHEVLIYTLKQVISEQTPVNIDLLIGESPFHGDIISKAQQFGYTCLGVSVLSRMLADGVFSFNTLRICKLPVGDQGTQIDIEGWFNGNIFTNILYTADDVVIIGDKSDPLYKASLEKLVPVFRKARHSGPVNLSAYISKDSILYNNLTARFTRSTMLVLKEGLGFRSRISDIFMALATRANRMFVLKPGFYTAVDIVLNGGRVLDDSNYNIRINGIDEKSLRHLWLNKLRKDDNGYFFNGPGGRILTATARGDTAREASRRAYRTVHSIKVPNAMFLTKVGRKANNIFNQIKAWGYIR